MHHLISIPPAAVEAGLKPEWMPASAWFAAADPAGQRLGSGGGSVHLLLSAWRRDGAGTPFEDWLRGSRKLMIHAGGQSRRLPAYAPAGKLFAPIPVWRWSVGQRIDQNLLDLQLPYLHRIYDQAAASYRLLIASGDVLVKFSQRLPALPEADVLCVGLWGTPEQARHFGVFFCDPQSPDQLAFFKQKPSPDTIRQHARNHLFLLDAGIWLFSDRAVRALLRLGGCPADVDAASWPAHPTPFELYSDFGLGLGRHPQKEDAELNPLQTAVIALEDGEFYHFGCSRDLAASTLQLQNRELNQRKHRLLGLKQHPDLFVQNACIDIAWTPEHRRIWVENAHIGRGWQLSSDHILTGIPRNAWHIRLPPGICLDWVPLLQGEGKAALRFYGMNDVFSGPIGDPAATWMGERAGSWFDAHKISVSDTGIDPATDLQQARLFPIVSLAEIESEFLQWLLDPTAVEGDGSRFVRRYIEVDRVSAAELTERADIDAVMCQRRAYLNANLPGLASNYRNSVFYRTDLGHMAGLYADGNIELPSVPEDDTDLMTRVRDRMFRAVVLRRKHDDGWAEPEREAFTLLREAVLEPVRSRKVQPRCSVMTDQIVWSRCPVRLDLAGGWTDTPPYCQLNGGRVVNLAVNLNGQPPLQTFIRRCDTPHIVLRSLDLGSQTTLSSYADIADCGHIRSEFSIAKAALALAGFHPGFGPDTYAGLDRQLEAFGGGLEISFVAAVPKGSGLGTSSILAATLLGALGDFCGLGWDQQQICNRTLALEQMLTSGGGWQDQFGAVLHGIKLLETDAGIDQSPRVKWLPEHLLARGMAEDRVLLYYTGITRVAQDILKEIVRGMFLNDGKRLAILEALGQHAEHTYDVIQRADWDGLCAAVARSWELNRQLDPGTCTPAIDALLDRIREWTAGAKLLGAGGGGYLLILARDPDAARQIRRELTEQPPNPRARFVTPEISSVGLQITRS